MAQQQRGEHGLGALRKAGGAAGPRAAVRRPQQRVERLQGLGDEDAGNEEEGG